MLPAPREPYSTPSTPSLETLLAMYQVKFDPEEFARIVPWLMLNRDGLNILVHPETTDAFTDHAVNALWLGEKLKLRLDVLVRLK